MGQFQKDGWYVRKYDRLKMKASRSSLLKIRKECTPLNKSIGCRPAYGLACRLVYGLAYRLACGLAYGLGHGLTYGLAHGLACGLAYRNKKQ
jgi:hypothetical protein